MFPRIFNLTMAGIKGGDAEVACQAIEFWSTVCDKEFDLDEEGVFLFFLSFSLGDDFFSQSLLGGFS